MAAAAAVMAMAGVILISLALDVPDRPPQPPAEAFGSVAPLSVGPVPGAERRSIPSAPPTSQAAETESIASSPPIALDIRTIGVHSELQYLGLTASGALEVPTYPRYHEAAWYKYSSEPGSPGPAVILGHVDSVQDGHSVFFNLGDLRPGDEILVTRFDGLIAVFAVDGVRAYPKDHFPTFLVYGDTDRASLRLITCGGRWNRAAHSFEDNIVVFASLTGFRETPRHATVS
jgi:Sortase domain